MRMPLVVVSSHDYRMLTAHLQSGLQITAKSPTIVGMAPMTLHPDSLAVHAGRDDLADLGVHALPLDLSSTNPLPGIDVGGLSYEVLATGGHPFEGGSHVYARLWNPTVARFEEALARLEHAEEAVAFSSGMAAMTAALLAVAHESGKRHVVAVRPLYGGTDHLLASGLLGVEATFCAPDEVAGAVRPDTALVVLETPANPTLELVDIRAVVAAAGEVPVLVDNTVRDARAAASARPRRRPLAAQRDEVPRRARRRRRRRHRLRREDRRGAAAHPRDHRRDPAPARRLPAAPRPRDAARPGARAAGRAPASSPSGSSTRPEVRARALPGLPECDPRGLIGTQQSGPGAMIAIELAGGFDAAEQPDRGRAASSRTPSRSAAWTRSSSIPPPSPIVPVQSRGASRRTRSCASRSASKTRRTSSPTSSRPSRARRRAPHRGGAAPVVADPGELAAPTRTTRASHRLHAMRVHRLGSSAITPERTRAAAEAETRAKPASGGAGGATSGELVHGVGRLRVELDERRLDLAQHLADGDAEDALAAADEVDDLVVRGAQVDARRRRS